MLAALAPLPVFALVCVLATLCTSASTPCCAAAVVAIFAPGLGVLTLTRFVRPCARVGVLLVSLPWASKTAWV
eukprot:2671435-Amphidinium_carterae.1